MPRWRCAISALKVLVVGFWIGKLMKSRNYSSGRTLILVHQQILKIYFQIVLDFLRQRFFGSFAILANPGALVVDGDVGGIVLRPTAAVEILNPITRYVERFVSVSTEDPLHVLVSSVGKRAGCNLSGKSQPCRIEALDEAHHPLLAEGECLHQEVKRREKSAEREIARKKPVKLMSVNGEVPNAVVLPFVFLIDTNAHQVRHHV